MQSIIKVVDNKCFIDSIGLSKLSNREPRAVNQLIKQWQKRLEYFGGLSFEMINSGAKGGRPAKVYYLNEQQATLLTTFMRDKRENDTVTEFKQRLVEEFFRMREYIMQKEICILASKKVRKNLTESVQCSGENERMHGHAYSTYTLMIYEIVGIKPMYEQYKKIYGKVDGFRKSLSEDELKRVSIAEGLVKPLLEMEKQYGVIKDTLKPLFEVKEIN